MVSDQKYMTRCIELARLGRGEVAPNPMVGAVIVWNDHIIGEGYHQQFGGPHAEVQAVNSVKDLSLLKDATIYVSLEPCAHHGKTPPCASLLIKYQFKRVVIACQDSFSKVSGAGIQQLRDAGIEVEVGVLEQESRELNKRFFTFHEKQRPYIILKWAQTKDGFIDKVRRPEDKGVNWISHPDTKTLVHQWRSEEQAILVGKNTVIADNPSLTVREVTGKNPIRIVLDSHLELKSDNLIFDAAAPTFVFNKLKNDQEGTVSYIQISDMTALSISKTLHQQQIQSVLIEGGTKVLQSFIDSGLWDEARIIQGDTFFKQGCKAPQIPGLAQSSFSFSQDTIYTYLNL